MNEIKIEKLSEHRLKEDGVFSWPLWSKEPSCFDWTYDGDEECYILDGEFTVETRNGNVHIKPGDFVTFKKGLKCTWDIKKAVKKHYNFP
ncbi:MAG: cupin domain-containing protein [Bacteroidetes bacterium]|nr:cupin domain-containing protein [Bacteroidota bacterium]